MSTLLDQVIQGLSVVDLSQPVHAGIPMSPTHPGYRHSLIRRHGDVIRSDGSSGASDLLVLGSHTGTHIDALSHISADGKLFGDVDATEASRGGRFRSHGVNEIDIVLRRGILVDAPKLLGVDRLEPGQGIGPDLLERAAPDLQPGDAVLFRTGWAQLWDKGADFISHHDGVPGPTIETAQILADANVGIVGSDTTAFEQIKAGVGHAELPVHTLLIARTGIPIIEMLNLEALSATNAQSIVFIVAPLNLVGATGSPVRPLALLQKA